MRKLIFLLSLLSSVVYAQPTVKTIAGKQSQTITPPAFQVTWDSPANVIDLADYSKWIKQSGQDQITATIKPILDRLTKVEKRLDSLLTMPVDTAKGIFKRWVPLPISPSFGLSTVTLTPSSTQCCGDGVYNYSLIGSAGSGGRVILNGNFINGFSIRQPDGDPTHQYWFTTTAGTILGPASSAKHGFSVTDHGNYVYLFGATPAIPIVLKGQFGSFLPAASVASGGFHGGVQNAVAKGTTAGSFQFNADASSGSFYDSVRFTFIRGFNSLQEVIYGGATHVSPMYAVLNYVYIRHAFGLNSAREFAQLAHVNHAKVYNVTTVGAGSAHTPSQDRNFQFDDSNGEIAYSIFYNGYEGMQLFSHGYRLHHSLVTFNNSGTAANILIGRTDTQYFAGSSRLNGDSIIIDHLCIKKHGTSQTYAITVEVRDAPVMVRDIVLENFGSTNVFDNRQSGYTNTISVVRVTSGTCPTPDFVNGYDDQDDYENQGLAKHYTLYGTVIGYRENTPNVPNK